MNEWRHALALLKIAGVEIFEREKELLVQFGSDDKCQGIVTVARSQFMGVARLHPFLRVPLRIRPRFVVPVCTKANTGRSNSYTPCTLFSS